MGGVTFSELRRLLRAGWRLAADPAYRTAKWLAWFGREGAFQPFNPTRLNRYPVLFAFLRDRLGEGENIRILSFGCSTGEEVFSLRAYLPRAAIKGIDINPANIATARARLARASDPGIVFEQGGTAAAEAPEKYDVILCLAVLRDGRLRDRPPRCDHRIRFEDFDRTIADFDRALKPGGLLALRFANFRFRDAAVAARFETILCLPRSKKTPIYGPDNCLLPGADPGDGVFMKRAAQ